MDWKHKIKFLLPSIIFIVVLVLFGVADNFTSDKEDINHPAAQVSYDEEQYQEGINLIKQSKWHDAGVKLVYLQEICYKDSDALYQYASARENFNKSDYGMAEYYINDVPDDYTGLFKEDIFTFKQECKQKVEKIKAEREPKKIIDSNGKQIWKIYIGTGSLHFTGTYKGTGNFIVKLSDSNQDLVEVIANEIGDFISDKTIIVPYDGWYYLEVYGSDGSWQFNWQ